MDGGDDTLRTGLDVELTGDERETVACWAEGGLQQRLVGSEGQSMGRSTDNVAKDHNERRLTTRDDGCRSIDDDGRRWLGRKCQSQLPGMQKDG